MDRPPDLVDRQFHSDAPNTLWVADITYSRTFAGWVYAAFVFDMFSRRVVCWQVSTSLRTNLALDASGPAAMAPAPRGADLARADPSQRPGRAIPGGALHPAARRRRGGGLGRLQGRFV